MSRNSYVASSYCPSKDWDRYCADQEGPEECPICGKENCTEDGEWVCKAAIGFCSEECGKKYDEFQKQEAAAEAAQYEYEQKLLREHNDKCPVCKGTDRKYCVHSANPDNRED